MSLSIEDQINFLIGMQQRCVDAIEKNSIPTSRKNRALAALFQYASEEYKHMIHAECDQDDTISEELSHCNEMLSSISAASYSVADAIENCPSQGPSSFAFDRTANGRAPWSHSCGISLLCGLPIDYKNWLSLVGGDFRFFIRALDNGSIACESPCSFNAPTFLSSDNCPPLVALLIRFNQIDAFIKLFQRGIGPTILRSYDRQPRTFPMIRRDPSALPEDAIFFHDETWVGDYMSCLGHGVFNKDISRALGIAWYALNKDGVMRGTGKFRRDVLQYQVQQGEYARTRYLPEDGDAVSARDLYIDAFPTKSVPQYFAASVSDMKVKYSNNPATKNGIPIVSPAKYKVMTLFKKYFIRSSHMYDASDSERVDALCVAFKNVDEFPTVPSFSTNVPDLLWSILPYGLVRSALFLADRFYIDESSNAQSDDSHKSSDKFLDNFGDGQQFFVGYNPYYSSGGFHGLFEAWPIESDGITRAQRQLRSDISTDHLLLFDKEHRLDAGKPCFTTRENFVAKFAKYSAGVLDGFYSPYGVVIGGAVVSSLDPNTDASNMVCPENRDIDICFPGLLHHGVIAEISRLDRFMRKKFGFGRKQLLTLSTAKTLTYVLPHPLPRVQVVLGTWQDCAHLLAFTDVDCTGVCAKFDFLRQIGDFDDAPAAAHERLQVYLSPRSLHSWLYRVNVPTAFAHAIRGSIQYEMRLLKYARRYGFAVIHADITTHGVIGQSLQRMAQNLEYKRPNQMIKFHGLAWLYLVHAGVFSPKVDVADVLDVSPTRTITTIRDEVIENGHETSDGYGITESGYRVAPDEEDAAESDDQEYDEDDPIIDQNPLHPLLYQFSYRDNPYSCPDDVAVWSQALYQYVLHVDLFARRTSREHFVSMLEIGHESCSGGTGAWTNAVVK